MSFSKDDLINDLERAGFSRHDTVLIHSSMKSIGEVDGGADTVLDALMEFFGDEGLLVFPTLSWRLNSENPRFYPEKTASQVGVLPELFRQRPGVKRSLHPTHSVAAYGPDAEAFVAGHELFDTPCARRSPWGKLADRGGKIIFIGTGINCNTFFHGVDEWSLPREKVFKPVQQTLYVVLGDREMAVLSWRHLPGHSSLFHLPEPELLAAGALNDFRFGDARCRVMAAAPAAETVSEMLKNNPDLFTPEEQL